jgi:ABC-type polysaccharide/polyol phosphate export permease
VVTEAPGSIKAAVHVDAHVADDLGIAIRTQRLVRRFGTFTAVGGVSIEVRGGEIFGLIGPNAQALIVYIVAVLMNIHLQFQLVNIIGVLLLVIMGSALFSMFSVVIACLVKTRERFMGIGQILTMPLFFASNAIYPLGLMPGWLRALSRINPLTCQVDGLRALMISGSSSTFGLGLDFAVLLVGIGVFVALAAKLYPRMAT